MNDTQSNYILETYRQTTAKLKKKFLRKPNVTEALDSFTQLALRCEGASTDMPEHAGMCWIAAAQCEGTLGNAAGETDSLLRSASQFASAERKCRSIGCVGPAQENLQAALSCYAHALSRYPDESPLGIPVNFAMARLVDDDNSGASITSELYLKNALRLAEGSLDTKSLCLEKLAQHYISTGNYVSALEIIAELTNIISTSPLNSARSDQMQFHEITSVMLLLIVRPAPQSLTPAMNQLLEKYTWGDSNHSSIKHCRMSTETFELIQNLVLGCQSMDLEAITNVQANIWQTLNNDQRQLLLELINIYRRY